MPKLRCWKIKFRGVYLGGFGVVFDYDEAVAKDAARNMVLVAGLGEDKANSVELEEIPVVPCAYLICHIHGDY